MTLKFDDGLEWIVKAPKHVDECARERMESEIATLKFLETMRTSLTPRVHSYAINSDNPLKTPFIIMDKMPGTSLGRALSQGLDAQGVRRALEGLASFRKLLQKHPFRAIGSLFLNCSTDDFHIDPHSHGEVGYMVFGLINLWSSLLSPKHYRGFRCTDVESYYFQQHALSLIADGVYDDVESTLTKRSAHFYLALLLPCYIHESRDFYLAHTDLSISNILVDPLDGTLLGIIDWEFANTLPPQSVEHYPKFLVEKDSFMDNCRHLFDDASTQLADWRLHYAKQFIDDPETSKLNDRIDAIIAFEYLLRHPNDRPLHKIAEAMNALKSANALTAPPPSFSWLESPDYSSYSKNGHVNGIDSMATAQTHVDMASQNVTMNGFIQGDHDDHGTPSQLADGTEIPAASKSSNSSQMIEMRILRPARCSTVKSQTVSAAPISPQNPREGNTNLTVNRIITQKDSATQTDPPLEPINVSIPTNNPRSVTGEQIIKAEEEKHTEFPSPESRSLNSFVGTNEAADCGSTKYKLYRPNFGGCFKIYRHCRQIVVSIVGKNNRN